MRRLGLVIAVYGKPFCRPPGTFPNAARIGGPAPNPLPLPLLTPLHVDDLLLLTPSWGLTLASATTEFGAGHFA